MAHTYLIEILYHFKCYRCTKWWSIGDYKIQEYITCPHCGFKAELEEINNEQFTKSRKS